MTKISVKATAVVWATVLFSTQVPQIGFAHPGHGGRPAPSSGDSVASASGETDGRSGDEQYSGRNDVVEDVRQLSEQSLRTQSNIEKARAQVSETLSVVKNTEEFSAKARRQTLRSVRSARRSNQRLVDDLGSFLNEHASQLSVEVQEQLVVYLATLDTSADELSTLEARLKNTRKCSGGQCAEITELLDREKDRMGQNVDGTAVTQALVALRSISSKIGEDL